MSVEREPRWAQPSWRGVLASLFALFSAAPTAAEWIDPTLELTQS